MEYFQNKGYKCLAPAWRGRDHPTLELRQNHPDANLGKLTLGDVVTQIESTVKSVDEKPIIIGHSMGGLVVQLILQKNLAVAGVAIDSAPPAGFFSAKWAFLKSNWPHISPFIPRSKPIPMTFKRFQYTFVNSMPVVEQQNAFERYVVPESRRIPTDALYAKIDFNKPHPPMLFIAGGADHLIPSSLNETNYVRYKNSLSITDYKEFPGRVHFIIGQRGWEEVADYIFSWVKAQNI
ncbi:MAG: alpha/beta hydrolase [Anaerolineales bacterium]